MQKLFRKKEETMLSFLGMSFAGIQKRKSLWICFFILLFCLVSVNSFGYTWEKIYKAKRWGGRIKVISVTGKVFINKKRPFQDSEYESRAAMRVSEGARILMEMPDGSVFLFKGPGVFSMELGTQISTLIRVRSGSVVGIKNRLSPHVYMIGGQQMNFGIRGFLIFAYDALTAQDQIIEGKNGDRISRPETIEDRICVLSGAVDYISQGYKRTEKIENITEPECNYIVFESAFYQYIPAKPDILKKDEILLIANQMKQGKVNLSEIDWDALKSETQKTNPNPPILKSSKTEDSSVDTKPTETSKKQENSSMDSKPMETSKKQENSSMDSKPMETSKKQENSSMDSKPMETSKNQEDLKIDLSEESPTI